MYVLCCVSVLETLKLALKGTRPETLRHKRHDMQLASDLLHLGHIVVIACLNAAC